MVTKLGVFGVSPLFVKQSNLNDKTALSDKIVSYINHLFINELNKDSATTVRACNDKIVSIFLRALLFYLCYRH